MPASTRTNVFISYSHADSQWLRLLNTHLKPLVRDQKLEIWSDQKIRKGERWRDRIHKQMAMARVGIFLVSADFLASDFIHAEELPPLLKAANQEGATLLTIIVRPCAGAFQDSPLSQLQAMNGPHAPLSGMSKTQREQVMASVYDELRGIFRAPAKAPAPRKPAAPRVPKRLAATKAAPATGAAAKSKAIAKGRAIAKNKAAATLAAKPPAAPRASKAARPALATPASSPASAKPAAKAAPQAPAKKAPARPTAPRAKK